MNILLYIIIFIMGTVFGSFLTLATYRIPLNQDITHKHSYCPKCNHKLNFLDMIPVWSYIFLGAKCRYCKSKIGPRYFIIEILCGIAFLALALFLNISVYTLTLNKLIEFAFGALYIVFLFLVAGIDIEHNKVDKRVLIYGLVIAISYMIYQYTCFSNFNANRFILYLVVIALILIFSTYRIKKVGKDEYVFNTLILCLIMTFFTYEVTTIISIIITLLVIAIKIILNKILNKRKKYKINIENQPIAFYLCIANSLTTIFIYILSIVGD